MKMSEMDLFLDGVRTAAISGHINPDGDCVGSCLAVKTYIQDNYPHIDADVYLQQPSEIFGFLKGFDVIKNYVDSKKRYDLLILLDIGELKRVKDGSTLVKNSSKTLCIDHHKTNEGGFDLFFNEPELGSACEAIYNKMDPDKISFDCAQALYTGIVHDTGVFRFPSTTPTTLRIAADLMSKGIPFSDIIEDSYYKKSYAQNLILGQVLCASELLYNGLLVFGSLTAKQRRALGLSSKDLDGIVNQLGNVRNADVALFMYELDGGNEFKISLRSKKVVDVSTICKRLGGGGHVRASGCNVKGSEEEVKALVLPEIEKELKLQGLL